jgi:hypothetical protein
MTHFLVKTFLSAIIIAAASELGKKSSAIGAILAALPLTSLMVMIWLYLDTKDAGKVADLSTGIFWAVLPSFIFFLSLPLLIKNGFRFPSAMALSCALMFAGYTAYVWVLKRVGVQF